MPELTPGQYEVVYNMLSLAIACMFASFVFFVLVRNEIAERYRGSIVASSLVVFIAGYHWHSFQSCLSVCRLDFDRASFDGRVGPCSRITAKRDNFTAI